MPSSSKRKPVDEARSRLNEKVTDVKNTTKQLHDLIDNISKEALTNAAQVLKETSKSKFLNKYAKSSQELESCLNRLLLVSDVAESGNGSDEEGSSEDDEGEDDDSKEDDNESCISVATVATDTTLHNNSETLSEVTLLNEHVQLSTIPQEKATTISSQKERKGSDIPLSEPSSPSSLQNEYQPDDQSNSLQRYDSQESLFSSVSMSVGRSPETTERYLDEEVKVEAYKWESDVAYPVIISNITTPWEFNVQLVDPNNDIMEQLCMKFMKEAAKGYKGGINYIPPSGMFCCAKSPHDDAWYRAKIKDVVGYQDTVKKSNDLVPETLIEVYFIDEGFDAAVTLSSLRPLEKKYATTPCQSFKCILGGIQPLAALDETKTLNFVDCNSMWKDVSINWFREFVNSKSVFAAYFYYPPKVSYDAPHKVGKETLVCDLYVNELDVQITWWKLNYNRPPIENHLSFIMVMDEIAALCPFFNSELDRKKSQRILSEKITERNKENTVKKEDNFSDKKPIADKETSINRKEETVKDLPCSTSDQNIDIKKEEDESYSKHSLIKEENISDKRHTISKEPYHIIPNENVKKESNESSNEHSHSNLEKQQLSPRENKSPKTTKKKNEHNEKLEITTIKEQISIVEKKSYTFGDSFQETKFVVNEPEGFAKICVSEVIDPGLFYIHLVTYEATKLDQLMTEINIFYEQEGKDIKETSIDMVYHIGMAVVTRYSGDKRWYRGIIVANKDTSEFNILHVDFGSNEWTTKDCLLPICEQFCTLPMETIPCCLGDIEPQSRSVTKQRNNAVVELAAGDESDEDTILDTEINPLLPTWSDQVTKRLKSLVVTEYPLMSALKSAEKNVDGLYEIYIYDTTSDQDIFINQLLVDEELVTSKVLCKQVPTIQIAEGDLEGEITETDALAIWDPMTEQYLSKRNAYSVNPDDTGVAMFGYVSQKKEICHNFSRYGRCYRGESCKYLHVKRDDPSQNFVEVFCDNPLSILPDIGDWVPLTVSALFDPTHFWVNFPYGLNVFNLDDEFTKKMDDDTDLDILNERMEEYYSCKSNRAETTDLTILAEGELVAARFQDDKQWYRARVINTADDIIQVFYVDYGNTEVTSEENIRKLVPDFLHLPHQAIECFLNETEFDAHIKNDQLAYDNIRNEFRDLTADKVLMAHIVDSSRSKKCIVVDLYDTSVTPNVYINQLVQSWDSVTYKKRINHNSFDTKSSIIKKNLVKYLPG